MNKQTDQALLSQMADIRGLRTIDIWPLAWGWWALLTILSCLAAGWIVYILRRRAYENSWKGDARRRLLNLREGLSDQSGRDVAAELSALMRRVAMQRFSRIECAGLEGKAWLDWLARHDPKNFDWSRRGRLLIEAPYAPPDALVDANAVVALIDAAKQWVA